MINDLVTKEDLILFTSGTRFTLRSVYYEEGFADTIASFDLFVRELPDKRNYLVFAGLEHILDFLLNLKFTDRQLKWLKKTYGFSDEVMKYYKKFKFTGDVYAMPEGSIFFANEPVIRIVAPIIEAQMVEIYLTNTIFLQTILASKISRFVCAAKNKKSIFGFNRSYGLDTAMKLDRVGKIVGSSQSVVPINSFRNPGLATFSNHMFHHFVTAFDSEIEAFEAHLKRYPDKATVLVDTYDTIKGVKNFIKVAVRVKEKTGKQPKHIMLDSGDIYSLSVRARKMLDDAGLDRVGIMGVSNLDEYKVDKMVKKNAPIDLYSGTTNILTPIDAPVLELVYKLNEIRKDGRVYPKMKLSSQKISLPGRKQVFRQEKNGRYIGDVIGLSSEKISGRKMLIKYISQGKLARKLPDLASIKKYYEKEKNKFKQSLLEVSKKVEYKVSISKDLKKLMKKTRKEIEQKNY